MRSSSGLITIMVTTLFLSLPDEIVVIVSVSDGVRGWTEAKTSHIIIERFDLESPNLTRTFTPSCTTPNMTSLAAPIESYRGKKLSKMPPPTAFDRLLMARRFVWLNKLVDFLFP